MGISKSGKSTVIVNHNSPAFYAELPVLCEKMLEAMEDSGDALMVKDRLQEPSRAVTLEELRSLGSYALT